MRVRIVGALLVAILVGALAWANWPGTTLPANARADRVLIQKGVRRLTLLADGAVVKSYRVALGGQPVGPKRQEGDRRTPEGQYVIDRRLERSAFHRALHISYPNADDTTASLRVGVLPGGAIMIHGIRNGLGWLGRAHRLVDWTSGCVAVTNPEIEEIWRVVANGTPVEIRP